MLSGLRRKISDAVLKIYWKQSSFFSPFSIAVCPIISNGSLRWLWGGISLNFFQVVGCWFRSSQFQLVKHIAAGSAKFANILFVSVPWLCQLCPTKWRKFRVSFFFSKVSQGCKNHHPKSWFAPFGLASHLSTEKIYIPITHPIIIFFYFQRAKWSTSASHNRCLEMWITFSQEK